MKNALVIGAGISGLASALRLQSQGYTVSIIEKNSFIGGKLSLINNKINTFNLTATMPILIQPYIDLFNEIGEDFNFHIKLSLVEPFCKAFFEDGSHFEFSQNLIGLSKNLQDNDFSNYLNLISKAKESYALINNNLSNINSTFKVKKLSTILKLKPLKTTYDFLDSSLNNKNLVNALAFQSMFIGMSPFTSPSVFFALPLINHTQGLYHIEGGLNAIIKVLSKIFLNRGGQFVLNSPVTSFNFKGKDCMGITINGDKTLTADLILSSVDFPYTLKHLIPKALVKRHFNIGPFEKDEMTCSMFILYLSIKGDFNSLSTHNIFINKNFKENINSAFNGTLPKFPSIYIYKDSYSNGVTNLNLLLRVPNLLYLNESFWTKDNIKKLQDTLIRTLETFLRRRNIFKDIISTSYITPVTFLKEFNNYAGSAYGVAPTLSHLFKPSCKIKNLNNLYFVGDSIYPGAGVSTVLNSAKIAVNTIIQDTNSEN